jgi:hypothetical protein
MPLTKWAKKLLALPNVQAKLTTWDKKVIAILENAPDVKRRVDRGNLVPKKAKTPSPKKSSPKKSRSPSKGMSPKGMSPKGMSLSRSKDEAELAKVRDYVAKHDRELSVDRSSSSSIGGKSKNMVQAEYKKLEEIITKCLGN